MTTLFVDAGNTNVKWQLGRAGELHSSSAEKPDFSDWVRVNLAAIDDLAVSSVQSESWNQKLVVLCSGLNLGCWFAQSNSESQGLISAYPQAQNLGVDRWLAMLALWVRSKKSFLLVDSGTALTLDVVDGHGQHLGGYILPGFEMQSGALLSTSDTLNTLVNESAGKLPSDSVDLGCSTSEAIGYGILASPVALIEKLMKNAELSSDRLVFTGGSAAQLQQLINQGRLEDDLVMQGLSLAYAYTQEQAQTRMDLNKI